MAGGGVPGGTCGSGAAAQQSAGSGSHLRSDSAHKSDKDKDRKEKEKEDRDEGLNSPQSFGEKSSDISFSSLSLQNL